MNPWLCVLNCVVVFIMCRFNPIRPGRDGGGGGGGGGKCPRRFQFSRTSLIFKQYLPNVATLLRFIGKQDPGKILRQECHMLPW